MADTTGIETGRERNQLRDDSGRFFERIRDSGQLPEGVAAEAAASAVLCTLERAISGGEARKLVAELPVGLRDFLRQCERHATAEAESMPLPSFLGAVADHLDVETEDALAVTRGVFEAAREYVDVREAEDVASQLSTDVREIWLRPTAETT